MCGIAGIINKNGASVDRGGLFLFAQIEQRLFSAAVLR